MYNWSLFWNGTQLKVVDIMSETFSVFVRCFLLKRLDVDKWLTYFDTCLPYFYPYWEAAGNFISNMISPFVYEKGQFPMEKQVTIQFEGRFTLRLKVLTV